MYNDLLGNKDTTEKKSMSCNEYLNKQVNKEMINSLTYQCIQNWCNKYGFLKASQFYAKQSLEEREHSNKILTFMQDADIEFKGYDLSEVKCDILNLVDAIEQSLTLEKETTQELNKIKKHSIEDENSLVETFVRDMLKEQIEEEAKFIDLKSIACELKTDSKLDMLHLDKYFK